MSQQFQFSSSWRGGHGEGLWLSSLVETMDVAARAATQIAASASQQATGMSQIHHAMSNINQASSQHLAATQQAMSDPFFIWGRMFSAMWPGWLITIVIHHCFFISHSPFRCPFSTNENFRALHKFGHFVIILMTNWSSLEK